MRSAPRVPDRWEPTGRLLSSHLAGATVTLLGNGKVLLVGGTGDRGTATPDAEVYDPQTGTWSQATPLPVPLTGHVATRLAGGAVLVAGGTDSATGQALAKAIVFEPDEKDARSGTIGRWYPAPPMTKPRSQPTATLLSDGRVLIAGGCATSCGGGRRPEDPDDAEIYDPGGRGSGREGTWARTGAMRHGRGAAEAVRLADGRVLVVGGETALPQAFPDEVFDPTARDAATGLPGAWQRAGADAVSINLIGHAVTVLARGDVLSTGGKSGDNGRAERVARRFHAAEGTWSLGHLMPHARYAHIAVTLPDGKVLVAGGQQGSLAAPLDTADLFDPVTGGWSPAARMLSPHSGAVAVLLSASPCGDNCGKVLVAGGSTCHACGGTASNGMAAELYTPP